MDKAGLPAFPGTAWVAQLFTAYRVPPCCRATQMLGAEARQSPWLQGASRGKETLVVRKVGNAKVARVRW